MSEILDATEVAKIEKYVVSANVLAATVGMAYMKLEFEVYSNTVCIYKYGKLDSTISGREYLDSIKEAKEALDQIEELS